MLPEIDIKSAKIRKIPSYSEGIFQVAYLSSLKYISHFIHYLCEPVFTKNFGHQSRLLRIYALRKQMTICAVCSFQSTGITKEREFIGK